MRGGKTGLVVMGVGEGGVGARGRCIWASWWARSRSWVCSRLDDRVMSWSEFSSGSECSLQRPSQGVVLGRHATSTKGCSVGTKWWRTITVIAS